MGRPKGSKNKKTLAKEQGLLTNEGQLNLALDGLEKNEGEVVLVNSDLFDRLKDLPTHAEKSE